MKTAKNVVVLCILVLGVTVNANAQFFEWLNKAAETVNKVSNTYNEARNTYNTAKETFSNSNSSSSSSGYNQVGSVSLIAWTNLSSGMRTTTRSSADLVVDNSGEKYLKKGSQVYSYYENSSYNSYSSDSGDPSYYQYYVYIDSKKYYFNM